MFYLNGIAARGRTAGKPIGGWREAESYKEH